jgi:hypothetical protein
MAETATLGVVKGFLVAEYSDHETGRHTFANQADFDKVRLGYACAFCLAEFTCYMAVCPLCHNDRDVARDMQETPADLQAHYDEANAPGEKTEARSMADAIAELMGDTDVEHVPLRKLRKSRRA